MKILINKFAGFYLRQQVPAHAGFTSNQFHYFGLIDSIAGSWIDVDTKYTFDSSHNGIMPDGTCISISKEIVSVVTEIDTPLAQMNREQRVSIITAIRTRQRELQDQYDKIERKGFSRNANLELSRINKKSRIRHELNWLDEECTKYFGL